MDNRQRVIDLDRSIPALDEMDKQAVRPEVAAILDQDIAEHGELLAGLEWHMNIFS